MALILCIETSTNICSVALVRNGEVLSSLEEHQVNSHATLLTVLIEKIMKDKRIEMNELDAVAVSSGPGSYTGLRIGVSVAKGICFAIKKPLIALTSLQILATRIIIAAKDVCSEPGTLICPMIDARRMEVYSALFDSEMNCIGEIKAEIIDSDSYASILGESKIIFAGNGSDKCRSIITHSNAVFVTDIYPLASAMAFTANEAYVSQRFEDVAYFEPFYLKDFIATIPKRKFF